MVGLNVYAGPTRSQDAKTAAHFAAQAVLFRSKYRPKNFFDVRVSVPILSPKYIFYHFNRLFYLPSMLRNRRNRLITVLFALMSFLFAQLALAGYSCPGSGSRAAEVAAMAQQGMPCVESMTMAMDEKQPSLCDDDAQRATRQIFRMTGQHGDLARPSAGSTEAFHF